MNVWPLFIHFLQALIFSFVMSCCALLSHCPRCHLKLKGNVFMSLLLASHPDCSFLGESGTWMFCASVSSDGNRVVESPSYGSLWGLQMKGWNIWSWIWHTMCSQYDRKQWLACTTTYIVSASSCFPVCPWPSHLKSVSSRPWKSDTLAIPASGLDYWVNRQHSGLLPWLFLW